MKNKTDGELYSLFMENATMLRVALAAHAELVHAHKDITSANSDLAASNRMLSEAVKFHNGQSGSANLDGGTIVPPNREKQKEGLRKLAAEDAKKKNRPGHTPSI